MCTLPLLGDCADSPGELVLLCTVGTGVFGVVVLAWSRAIAVGMSLCSMMPVGCRCLLRLEVIPTTKFGAKWLTPDPSPS